MAYGKRLQPARGLAGFCGIDRKTCRGTMRGVYVIEPNGLADCCDRLKGLQPGIAVVRWRISPKGPLREADHDPSRRRLMPVQIAVRRITVVRQIRGAV